MSLSEIGVLFLRGARTSFLSVASTEAVHTAYTGLKPLSPPRAFWASFLNSSDYGFADDIHEASLDEFL